MNRWALILSLVFLLLGAEAAAWEPPRQVGPLIVTSGVTDEQAQRFVREYQAEKQQEEEALAAWRQWWQQQPPPGFPTWHSYDLHRYNPIWQQIRPGMGAGLYGGGASLWPSREQEIDDMLDEWREGKLRSGDYD